MIEIFTFTSLQKENNNKPKTRMLMKRKNLLLTFMVIVLFSGATFAQGIIRGVIQDVNTDETLIGATVVIDGTTIGVTTNLDGSFLLIAPEGEHKLVYSYVGYETQYSTLSVKDGATYNVGTILMKSSAIGLQELNVFANVAIDRKTPVAVSTLDAAQIQEKLGSQELPEVLNETPSVYAVKQGGGFGDSRINIRGFDQRNIAVMVNGIPVNDMENGWVYWSNWAGLGDALRSMQVQRGLGASKLAINSVGGTMNMITKTTDVNRGGSFMTSVTDYGNTKMLLSLSTGKTENGWSISFVGSRTKGPGYIDKTWVDAWSYFVSVSKEWKNHLITFTAIGAPQQHGQRSYTVSEGNFEKYGAQYNQHWGTYDGNVLMERQNNYHKPQFAANWYWTISEKSFLATSVYSSFGKGYGTGTLDNRKSLPRYRIGRTDNGQIDWDGAANENATHIDTAHFDNGNYAAGGNLFAPNGDTIQEGGVQLSKNILRESVNEHTWWGIISTFNHTFNNKSTLMVGIDGRMYEGRHFRRVRNLLGGDYWFDGWDYAVDGVAGREQLKSVGDKIAYDNDGLVRYGGAFAQYEISFGSLSLFGAGAISNTWYGKVDRYNYVGGDDVQKADYVNALGYNIKGGLNFNINEANNVFLNIGYYSRAPYWDFVFVNRNKNSLVPVNDILNEKIFGVEVGYGLRVEWMALNFNLYYTDWADKSYTDNFTDGDDNDFTAPVMGLKATHMGAELDAKFRATRWLDFYAVVGYGNWKWKNDVEAVIYDDNGAIVDTVNVYASDVVIGDQPQTQVVLGTKVRPMKGLQLTLSWRHYDRLYRGYDVTELDKQGYEVEQLPSYSIVDFYAGYEFKIAGLSTLAGVNVYNVLDNVTKSQGDKYGYFWTFGRTFNFSLAIKF